LAEIIQACIQEKNRQFNNLRRCERYKGHNLLMLAAMQGFKQLFAAKSDVIVNARI
jgi:hypothetical protein